MKNLLFTLAATILTFIPAMGQQMESDSNAIVWTYCELLGTQKILTNKVNVEVDYGQEVKAWSFQDDRIVDPATGKAKTFNSMVDAMNFMGLLGWEFVQAYVVSIGNQNVYHWLLKLQVQKNEVGKYIPLTRNEAKKGKG
jgi:hypothetical protein